MTVHDLQMLIGPPSLTILEAMRRIDKNTCGILFITDE